MILKQFINYFKIICNRLISLFKFCIGINETKSCNKIKDLEKKIQKCEQEKCELVEDFNERIDTIEHEINTRLNNNNNNGLSTSTIELVDFRYN